MSKETKSGKKISYSYRVGECDHKTLEKILFIRKKLLADILFKTIVKYEQSKSSNLQSEGDSRQANLQTAGW